MQSKVIARATCIFLALLGLATSVHLLLRTVSVMRGTYAESLDVCSALFGSNCDYALMRSAQWSIGIPLPGWGIVFYGAMLYLLFMGWGLAKSFGGESGVAAFFLACVGTGASIVLGYLMFTSSDPFCPLCLVVHVINALLIGATYMLDGRGLRAISADALSGVRYLLGAKSTSEFAPWKLSGFITCALLGAVIFEAVFIQVKLWNLQAQSRSVSSADVIAAYAATPFREIQVRDDDPRIGSADAPVQMVVFSDFQCPACKWFKKELDHVLSHYGDHVSVVFKHFPLDNACNDRIDSEFHVMACTAAYAAEAAREQGLFWPLHDALFDADLKDGPEQIRGLASGVGLDLVAYDAAINGETVRHRVATDIEQGQLVDLTGTPTLFVNGKLVANKDSSSIETVIAYIAKDLGIEDLEHEHTE